MERIQQLEQRIEELEKKVATANEDNKLEVKFKKIIKSNAGLTVRELRENALKQVRREGFSDSEVQELKKLIDCYIETLQIPAQ